MHRGQRKQKQTPHGLSHSHYSKREPKHLAQYSPTATVFVLVLVLVLVTALVTVLVIVIVIVIELVNCCQSRSHIPIDWKH